MKRLTASEARREWFRLLDDVAAGEVVVIERRGRRIVIRREDRPSRRRRGPDYRDFLRVRDADHADHWTWEWSEVHGAELRDEENGR